MPGTDRPFRKTQVYNLADNIRNKKYYKESFKGGQQPFLYSVSATGIPAVATTAAGADVTHRMQTAGGGYWDVYNTTDQAVLPFGTAGSGLNISCDLVNNEAIELVPGGNAANSNLAFVAGTDSDFFIKAKFKITDADGSDQFLVGFRKQEAFAVPTSILTTGDGIYTDFCGIGFAATVANPNVVKVAYDLNNGGSTTVANVGFTWADTEVHTLEMRVKSRKAYFLINGVRIGGSIAVDGDGTAMTAETTVSTADGAFTFDSGDTLVPFIFLRHDTNVSETLYLQEIEIGHLVDVGLDPDQE